MSTLATFMVGKQIENYQIEAKLGEGGMGVVYKARDTNLDRTVALKVLKSAMAADAAMLERFRSEARAQATLTHPNIATLYNFFVHQDSPVMVMEFVDGETLQRLIERRGSIPAVEAVALFRQALLGTGAAHQLGIIHRDIKPGNLMLNRLGVVKVMDFGIAKVANPQQTLTRSGIRVGTAYYMSPEQIKGEPVDIRTDIYALGITLYELLTAHVPFFGDSEFQILSDHVHRTPPPPSQYLPQIPKDLEAIVLKALEKDGARRFQTVPEFCTALDKAALIPPTQAPHVPLSWHAPLSAQNQVRSNRKTTGKLVAGAIVMVCALCIAGFVRFTKPVQQENRPQAASSPAATLSPTPPEPPVATTTVTVEPSAPAKLPEREARPAQSQPAEPKSFAAAPSKSKNQRKPSTENPEAPAIEPASAAPSDQVTRQMPPASAEALEEAAHRLARLRSRAASLHANLDDLRRNLAMQGLSVRGEGTEAAANLDLYLQEAERALEASDLAAATTNLDRADQAAKKVASITGG